MWYQFSGQGHHLYNQFVIMELLKVRERWKWTFASI